MTPKNLLNLSKIVVFFAKYKAALHSSQQKNAGVSPCRRVLFVVDVARFLGQSTILFVVDVACFTVRPGPLLAPILEPFWDLFGSHGLQYSRCRSQLAILR